MSGLAAPIPAYAELHCLSNFSFLRGASHPEEMVERARELGYAAIAITDECSFAGVVRAHVAAKDVGLRLIIGSEFTLDLDDAQPDLGRFRALALCRDRNGYGNLGELITTGRMRREKGRYRLFASDLEDALEGCFVLLLPAHDTPDAELEAQARWLATHFAGRAWIAVELLHRLDDFDHAARLRRVSSASGVPLIAAGNVHMHLRSRKPLQDALTAIRLRTPVQDCGFELMPNAEAHLRSRMRLATLYDADLLAQTVSIAERCRFSLDELRYEYPQELVPKGRTPASHLKRLVVQGMRRRYGRSPLPPKLIPQLKHELALVRELDYERFFLTVEDIVRFARHQGILCQGRGSAANSAVCYCLGITEVRPEEGNLLFERFISRARNEPPDIDVDFEHQRREEVIQYIYAKYGRHRTALAATVIRYRPRSALRDVGRALGVDPAEVDRLAKSHQWWDGRNVNRARLAEVGFDADAPVVKLWAELTDTLIGFPRHLSQHVGGFVIAADRLARLVPIENAAMPDRSVIEWDKDDLDALKLLKVDVLALGMLSVIRRSLEFVSAKLDHRFEMGDVPADCKATWSMIQKADTVGVFQIESRAQMSMLPRLKPDKFYDLVIEVAIVRPGPIQGGMVHPYLRRKQGLEKHTLPKEELKAALERTLGVPIFQEQVMQIAMIAAEFTADEADQLRRAMAAWRRKGSLEQFHARMVGSMVRRGYTPEFSEAIFKQTEGFGEYGFPESHAAGFAKLAWISSWLKQHHPDAFLAALLNSQPMGFYAPSQLVQDARRHGVVVRPVDVVCSDWGSTLEEPQGPDGMRAVRLGLDRVAGLREIDGLRIADERRRAPFANAEDLARRCRLDPHALQALAGADALRSLTGHRRQAHWQVAAFKSMPKLLVDARFDEAPLALEAASEGQEIVADYRALGLTLGRHPLALLRGRLLKMRLQPADVLNAYPDGRLARACGLVTVRQRPGTAKGTMFVTLEDETGPVNVIVWPDLVEKQPRELLGSALLAVYGVWQSHGEVRHLVARRLTDLSGLLGDLRATSRDFH